MTTEHIAETAQLVDTEVARIDYLIHERLFQSDDDRTASVVDAVNTMLATRFSVVGELHEAFDCCNVRCPGGGWHCRTCEEGMAADGGNVHWPCPTMRALGVTTPPGVQR